MKKMYEGDAKCVGCQKSGKIQPRWAKDELCEVCKEELKLGRAFMPEFKPEEYVWVFIEHHSLSQYDSDFDNLGQGKNLEAAFKALLTALDHPNIYAKEKIELSGGRSWSHSLTGAHVRLEVGQALKEFAECLKAQQIRYKELLAKAKQVDKYLEEHKQTYIKQVQDNERSAIYNEGVEYGKSLLIQLNNNEITLSEFDKKIEKY